MPAPADHSATSAMRDGRDIEIRALRPDDKDDMLAAVGPYRQGVVATTFLYVQARASRRGDRLLCERDFANHVALIALAEEDGRKFIIGGGRYVVVEPGKPRSPLS